MDDSFYSSSPTNNNQLSVFMKGISQRYQLFLDIWTPYPLHRWIFTAVVMILFMGRVFLYHGWYIITYALGIYYLNLFLAFIPPKIDPAMFEDDLNEEGPSLPTNTSDEFKPFIRRLPEFKFWVSSTKAALIALFCSLFEAFNIPVFWPILVLYFFTLFGITMKRQIKHMIKYKYLPWSRGKVRYRGKDDTGRVYAR